MISTMIPMMIPMMISTMIPMMISMMISMMILMIFESEELFELLQLDKSGIKVAHYMTELPSKELLQRQLHKGLEAARQRWENCLED